MRRSSATVASGSVLLALLAGAACSSTQGLPTAVNPSDPPPPAAPGTLTRGELDHLLLASWQKAGVKPAPLADDGEYLRRVTLDLVGRPPTLVEAKAFLADAAPDKRERVVTGLLASPGFGEHWADVYGELLFGNEGNKRIDRKSEPRDFLVKAFNESWGYDRLAQEILTASGSLADNGALAFIAARARGGGGPEAVTGAAARLFLGLQIQCAQCHDHPYDPRWKQEDFYGLVAYFARTKAKQENSMGGKTFVVVDQKRGQAKMRRPRTESDVVVEPRFLGHRPEERSHETRRQTLARAILASDLFAKAMVARTWAHLFGRGLPDPWDDLGAEHDPKHPEILNRLAEDFRASGFDMKRLMRQMVLSTAYARSARPAPGDDGAAVRAFARAGVRPLRPEQLFRTLITVTGASEIARRRNEERAEKLMANALREYKFAFDDDEMAAADTFDGSVPQALLLMNGELTNNGARAVPGSVLGEILAATKDPAARVEDMFVAAYARRPSPEEKATFLEHVGRGDKRRGYEDAFFALLLSTEAVTNH